MMGGFTANMDPRPRHFISAVSPRGNDRPGLGVDDDGPPSSFKGPYAWPPSSLLPAWAAPYPTSTRLHYWSRRTTMMLLLTLFLIVCLGVKSITGVRSPRTRGRGEDAAPTVTVRNGTYAGVYS